MDVNDALHRTCLDYPGGVPLLAKQVGLAASTLYSLANKNAADHGWSLERFRKVLHSTGDTTPLEALCAEFDGLFVRLPKSAGRPIDEVYRDIARLAKEFGDVPRVITKALVDGRVSQKEYERIEREVIELQQAGAELLHRLAATVQKKP